MWVYGSRLAWWLWRGCRQFERRTQEDLFTQLHWRKRMAQIYSPDEASPVDLSSLRVKRWGILKSYYKKLSKNGNLFKIRLFVETQYFASQLYRADMQSWICMRGDAKYCASTTI